MTLLPFTDCCLYLGVDPKTLRLWLKTAHLSCCQHPWDARLKCLTASQLQHLAHLHDRSLPSPLSDTASEVPADPSCATTTSCQPASAHSLQGHPWEAQVDLRQQVILLQAQVATLQGQVTELALALLRHQQARGPEPFAPLNAASLCSLVAEPSPAQAAADPLSSHTPVAVSSAASAQHPEPLVSSRTLALIEYWSDGTYGVISPTEGVLSLVPDSPQWFDWLATLPSFRFLGQQGRLSASRNKGRASWMAYRRIHGHCYAHGLGLTRHLSIAHLERMAATLQSHASSR